MRLLAMALVAALMASTSLAYYTCDHGQAIGCFQGVDGALSNTVSQGKNGLTQCQVAKHLWFDFFQCMRYSSCWTKVYQNCDQFVAVTNLYLGGSFGNPVGSVENCSMPTDCEHLFGSPNSKGVWVINPASTAEATLAVSITSVLVAIAATV